VLSIAKKRDAPWFWVNLAMISQGLREGVFVFLIGLLVYVVVKNEFALGSFFMVQSAVSCFAFFIVSHFMKPLRRYRFILLGSLMMGLVIVPFVWSAGSVTLWILGVGAAFFYPFYMAPLTATVFDVIGATQASARRRVEFVVARELALDLGRIMGILLFIWWIRDSTVLTRIPWVLLLLGFTQLLAWLAIRQVPMGNEDGSKQK
jgi:YQGE family putative transporter